MNNWYEGLKYHHEEALKEIGKSYDKCKKNPDVAIFARSYYNQINNLSHEKKYDYVFIGALRQRFIRNRLWVIEFAKKHFTKNSIFINTMADENWKSLGTFDLSHSHKSECFSPMNCSDDINQTKEVQYRIINENKFYFETMCQSKFCLCPAGDSPWSFRFYEVLMCKSIPIVESWLHTFRTETEALFGYKYLLYNEFITFDENIIKHNTTIFEKNHLLPKVHFFTLGTDKNKLKDLIDSAEIFNINVNCALAPTWRGFIDKIYLGIETYKDIPENEIICFIDGYDTIINSNVEEIVDKFKWYKTDLLFGAEINCFPDYYRIDMDKVTSNLTRYRYLNSGGYIGYKHAIMDLLLWKPIDDINKIIQNGGDQSYFMLYYINNREKIKLDNRQKIFQNMYLICWNEVCVCLGRFYNTKLDEFPCFVHFSGNSWTTTKQTSIIPEIIKIMKDKNLKQSNEIMLSEKRHPNWETVSQL